MLVPVAGRGGLKGGEAAGIDYRTPAAPAAPAGADGFAARGFIGQGVAPS